MVAAAALGQMRERCSHLVQFGDLALEACNMVEGDALHVGALATAIAPELKKLIDLGDGETKIPRTAHET